MKVLRQSQTVIELHITSFQDKIHLFHDTFEYMEHHTTRRQ